MLGGDMTINILTLLHSGELIFRLCIFKMGKMMAYMIKQQDVGCNESEMTTTHFFLMKFKERFSIKK